MEENRKKQLPAHTTFKVLKGSDCFLLYAVGPYIAGYIGRLLSEHKTINSAWLESKTYKVEGLLA